MDRHASIRCGFTAGPDKIFEFRFDETKADIQCGFPGLAGIRGAHPGSLLIAEKRDIHRAGNPAFEKFTGRAHIDDWESIFALKILFYGNPLDLFGFPHTYLS
jgi:hypothetical protein